jgi:hypothetical protein
MIHRRTFLSATAAGFVTTQLSRTAEPPKGQRKKLAVVTTEWRYRSHAWHMAERFLAGYPVESHWHHPPFDVVSAYVDQFPKGDLSHQRAEEFKFKIYPTIAEALRCGGDKLAVDAVLVIGEHGNYPVNKLGQTQYPRYEFFKQVVTVFEKDGRVVPMFNDKHLSWKWEWAKEMVDTVHKLKIPFLAGSSLPVTWRMPSIDMPMGADVEEMLGVAIGRIDSYDFHALEMIQCMAERRKGGETGVKSMRALRGEAVWNAMVDRAWSPRLFEACLCRTQTLTQGETTSHRFPTAEQLKSWVKEPIAYMYEYIDGTKATMLLLNGLVGDFTFAAKIKGEKEPVSTLFYLPPNPNVTYSAALMAKAEENFVTGKPPYPIERTLLTTGLVEAGVRSLAEGKKLETPHLAIKYEATKESQYLRS